MMLCIIKTFWNVFAGKTQGIFNHKKHLKNFSYHDDYGVKYEQSRAVLSVWWASLDADLVTDVERFHKNLPVTDTSVW